MPPLRAPEAKVNSTRVSLSRSDPGQDEFLQALLARRDNGPERKLQKLVDFDENHADHNPQTVNSSRSERMKPVPIADYLEHIGRWRTKRRRRDERPRHSGLAACELAKR